MKPACEQYRLLIGADPQHLNQDAQEHIENCVDCRNFYQQTVTTDKVFVEALKLESISPIRNHSKRLAQANRWLAVAASVVAIGILSFLSFNKYSDQSFSKALITHLAMEPNATKKSPGAANASDIQSILSASHLELQTSSDLAINYIMRCIFEGESIVHMVIQSDHGPVTVLWLNEDFSQLSSNQMVYEKYHVLIKPVVNGALVVLSLYDNVDTEAERILSSIKIND